MGAAHRRLTMWANRRAADRAGHAQAPTVVFRSVTSVSKVAAAST
jgi:hypothetical protein